jgi:hypothetical protein
LYQLREQKTRKEKVSMKRPSNRIRLKAGKKQSDSQPQNTRANGNKLPNLDEIRSEATRAALLFYSHENLILDVVDIPPELLLEFEIGLSKSGMHIYDFVESAIREKCRAVKMESKLTANKLEASFHSPF